MTLDRIIKQAMRPDRGRLGGGPTETEERSDVRKSVLGGKTVCESANRGMVSPLSFPEARPLPGLGDLSRPMGQSF